MGLGDSFVYGDELIAPGMAHYNDRANDPYREQNCFLGLLGCHYDVEVKNYAYPGNSCLGTIWNYIWWIKNYPEEIKKSLVLVGITDPSRHSFFDIKHQSKHKHADGCRQLYSLLQYKDSDSESDRQWYNLAKNHTMLCSCEEFSNLTYHQTLLFFDGISQRHSGVFQFHTCAEKIQLSYPCSTLLWSGKNLVEIMDSLGPGKEAKYGHPNEEGHRAICDLLIKEIDYATI